MQPRHRKKSKDIKQIRNIYTLYKLGFPDGTSGKEPACQCRRHKRLRFDPWVRKIPLEEATATILEFLPGESLGQRSLAGYSP